MFWDGFQWVAKVNTTGNVDPAVLAQTKKMRRLVISNLPLTLGIGENEVGDFVTKFIVENYLNDEGNFHPVKEVTIDTAKNSATIELSSVEETNKLAKVEAIKILGSNCRVAKVGDPKLNSTVGNLITDAQYSGQAAAAALAALTMLSNKGTDASFTLSKVNVLGSTSKILKVTNLVDPEHAKVITSDEVQEIYEDISGEFSTLGKVVESFIVKKEKATSGAEAGTVFLIFEETSGAEKAYNTMSNKRYENRDIRITYIDEETYKKSFAHLKA
jgi:RNA recognition motif-containing protein